PYLERKAGRKLIEIRQNLRALQSRRKRERDPEPQRERDQSARSITQGLQLRQLYEHNAAQYTIEPYPGRISVFVLALRDAMDDSLFDPALGSVDPTLGWGRIARDGVEIQELPGGHLTILQEPHVSVLGTGLRRSLERAQGIG